MDFYGGGGDLCAALWQWHQQWGAELVASWGTMLQLIAGRAPGLTDQAWELSGQLLGWGPNTSAERWMTATAVATSDAWFLHNRP